MGEHIKNRYGVTYTYYRCGRRTLGYEVCRAPAPTETDVNDAVAAALSTLRLPDAVIAWVRQLVSEYRSTEEASSVALARERNHERDRVEGQLRKLTDLALQGLVDDDDLVARRAALVERRTELAGAGDVLGELDAWDANVAALVDAGQTLAAAFREGTQDERRALLWKRA